MWGDRSAYQMPFKKGKERERQIKNKIIQMMKTTKRRSTSRHYYSSNLQAGTRWVLSRNTLDGWTDKKETSKEQINDISREMQNKCTFFCPSNWQRFKKRRRRSCFGKWRLNKVHTLLVKVYILLMYKPF